MTAEMVRTERRGKVLEVTFDRVPVNAINREASRAIYRAFRALQDDPGLTVGLLLSGRERVFSAGWDLKEVAKRGFDLEGDNDPETGHGPGGFAGLTEFWDLLKPVVAAVNGAAIGGGFELALSCDIIVASADSYFALPEMQRGFLADAGATQRLPRRVPYHVAVEMLLTGRRMEAEEALRWGLINKILPREELVPTARAIAQDLSKGAPLAMQGLKQLLLRIESMPLREAMAKVKPGNSGDMPTYEAMMRSEDALEGPRAYVEKREPRWKGR